MLLITVVRGPKSRKLPQEAVLEATESLARWTQLVLCLLLYHEYMKQSLSKWPWLAVIDAVLIILFALLGRREHEHGLGIGGIFITALPFLVAYVLMTVLSRPWLTINKIWPTGLLVWLGTVVLGMALRLLMGKTAAISFVIVTLIVLGVFLLGRRGISLLIAKRSQQQKA